MLRLGYREGDPISLLEHEMSAIILAIGLGKFNSVLCAFDPGRATATARSQRPQVFHGGVGDDCGLSDSTTTGVSEGEVSWQPGDSGIPDHLNIPAGGLLVSALARKWR
jgi:hypothetical protein